MNILKKILDTINTPVARPIPDGRNGVAQRLTELEYIIWHTDNEIERLRANEEQRQIQNNCRVVLRAGRHRRRQNR